MLKNLRRCLLLLCVLAVFGGAALVSAQEPIPVIIDSDMNSDDWMAILYLLNDPGYSVKAITVVGTGFTYCDAGIRTGLGLLALTEYGDVPVSCWTETPLMGENAPPSEWRTNMEYAESLGLPEGGEADERNAMELFTATVEDSASNVTVLALGPLTNIGAALEAKPELADKIDMIYVMGGAVDVPGSPVSEGNAFAEWNIYSDPHAARLTFESGAPITLVPLDATNEAPVTTDFLATLEGSMSTPESEFVHMLLNNNLESIEGGFYFFWDPLAAAVMTNPELVTLVPRDVTVIDIPGAPDDGRTKPVRNGSSIMVATAPDTAALQQLLLDTWNS